MAGYARNCWYVACWTAGLAEAAPLAMAILGEPIVIFRSEGRVVALEDRCVHRLAPLSRGRCEGPNLRCMYHGLLFDPQGRVIEIPGQDLIPEKARVKSYPVADRHDWVWIWMGDPALAGEALIPPAVGLSDPDWVLGHGTLDYEAEARLINDNLLDFSHLTYVHANSFQATDVWARSRPRVTVLDRGIRTERWMTSSPRMRSRPGDGLCDAWSSYDFLVPGVLLMTSGVYPEGTAARCGFGPPDPALPAEGVTFTSQAVTPMGDRTARYFFSWGPRKDQGDEALRDVLMGIAGQAFAEDKAMIEAQQRVIKATPNPQVMPTSGDQGVIAFQRLVDRMIAQEDVAAVRQSA
ncbi:MAG TPA: aromatic ring-hydroxylating dioxygenase subunit alpha [Caulobacteraceae bacterium]